MSRFFDPKRGDVMTSQHPPRGRHVRSAVRHAVWILGALAVSACAAAKPQLPKPRPIIVHSGARIKASEARLDSINTWVTKVQDNIQNDPSFMVDARNAPGRVYPWSFLEFGKDSVRVWVDPQYPSTQLPFMIYGYLHLMARMGRLAKWLPEAPHATGFQLERAILARVADTWLLARAVYGASPYEPLDELLYAHEDGYLDALIFTARPNKFEEARKAWAAKHPNAAHDYRTWFKATFNKEPPGLR